MTRQPGASGGPIGGNPEIASMRLRRHSQKTSLSTGDYLGSGLTIDRQGRMAIRQLSSLDPEDPNFTRNLVNALKAAGLMEK